MSAELCIYMFRGNQNNGGLRKLLEYRRESFQPVVNKSAQRSHYGDSDGDKDDEQGENSCGSVAPSSSSGGVGEDSSSSSSATAVMSDADDVSVKLPVFPLVALGVHCRTEDFTHKSKKSRSHKRIIASCLYEHAGCVKRRGLAVGQTPELGPWGPIVFCVAWSQAGWKYDDDKAHNKHMPTKADVLHAFQELVAADLVQ